MYRPASRSVLRAAPSSLSPARAVTGRRFISTEPPHLRSRSWKSSGLRWGLAIAGLYYYNTSPVFAEQPQSNLLNPNLDALDDSDDALSLDALTSRKSRGGNKNAETLHSAIDAVSSENASTSISAEPATTTDTDGAGIAGLEEEAETEGAFNEETGEINWDCSCLGGMAHGPCGPQFREAFSCFVFSKEEPKGMDCIEKFQGMRDCFQEHPDVYKDELVDDEEIDREVEAHNQELAHQISERQKADINGGRRLLEEPTPVSAQPKPRATAETQPSKEQPSTPTPNSKSLDEKLIPKAEAQLVKDSPPTKAESTPGSSNNLIDDVIPAAAHDATSANKEKASN